MPPPLSSSPLLRWSAQDPPWEPSSVCVQVLPWAPLSSAENARVTPPKLGKPKADLESPLGCTSQLTWPSLNPGTPPPPSPSPAHQTPSWSQPALRARPVLPPSVSTLVGLVPQSTAPPARALSCLPLTCPNLLWPGPPTASSGVSCLHRAFCSAAALRVTQQRLVCASCHCPA